MTQIAVRCCSCNSYKLVVKKDDVCVTTFDLLLNNKVENDAE